MGLFGETLITDFSKAIMKECDNFMFLNFLLQLKGGAIGANRYC